MVTQTTPTLVSVNRPIERREVTRPVESSRNVSPSPDSSDPDTPTQVVLEADEGNNSSSFRSNLIEDMQRQYLDSNKAPTTPIAEAPESIQANRIIAQRAFEAVSEKAKEQTLSESF